MGQARPDAALSPQNAAQGRFIGAGIRGADGTDHGCAPVRLESTALMRL